MFPLTKVNAFIDAEWVGGDWSEGRKILSLQLLLNSKNLPPKKFLIINSDYEKLLASKGYLPPYLKEYDCCLLFSHFADIEDRLTKLIYNYVFGSVRRRRRNEVDCNLFFFYSPKDLWIAIGWENFRELITPSEKTGKATITQKRTTMGYFTLKLNDRFKVNYALKDIAGWTNLGLQSLAEGLGLETGDKSLLDPYKARMDFALVNHTDDFIRYSMNDVVLLEQVLNAQVKMVNWLTNEVLKIPLEFTPNSIPMTQGRLVSTIFEFCLTQLIDKKQIEQGAERQEPVVYYITDCLILKQKDLDFDKLIPT